MIAFFVVLFAWFFQSITGFGAGIFIIGILSIFYDPKMVIVSSALFNLLGTLSLIYQNRKGKIEYYLLFSLIFGSIPGIFLGAYVLDRINTKELIFVVAGFISLLGLYDLAVYKGWLRLQINRHMGIPVGFWGGFFAGLVGMGGPPPLVFLTQHLQDPTSIRLMLNLFFTSNILFRLSFYNYMDVVSLDVGFLMAGLLGLLAGTLLGDLFAKKISANQYRAGVPYMIILLGFVLFVFGELHR
ncbi:MAG: sulfite exporter TauE/SafE family protein [Aquificaceae bacterium]|nr:sulfite exporter TauE/SafE family protein [Aquificaceae bacterium]